MTLQWQQNFDFKSNKGKTIIDITLRKPKKSDAKQIFKLVDGTNVLDLNSEYLYLLQTTYFKDTCAVALVEDEVIGFVSGYIDPRDKNVLFIWQVGVNSKYRGRSVAKNLIIHILDSISTQGIKYIHTTISPSNSSSQRVFEKLANEFNADIQKESFFELEDFIDAHEEEILYKIGPLK